MTYQQLTLNYTEAYAAYTPNWANPCGLPFNPCNPFPPAGTCGGICDTGAFTACNGGIWMNPCSSIVDAAAIPLPPPSCPVTCCTKKSCGKSCGKSKKCNDDCSVSPQCSTPIPINYCDNSCATPICITPCPQPVIPLVPLVQLDPCLNPWAKNLPWLQRTYAGRYDIIPRV
jgi:hypothetical protein